MAFLQFCFITSDLDSTNVFEVVSVLSVFSMGLYPNRIWLGDSPVVALIQLL